MKIVKWFLVSLVCAALSVSLAIVGIGYVIDRSVGSTAFVSSYIEQLSLKDAVSVEAQSGGAKTLVGTARLLMKFGATAIETHLKQQVKPVLDGFYAHLKGQNDKAQLKFDFRELKKDPKFFLVPTEMDLLKVANIETKHLAGLRGNVMQFYALYRRAIAASLISIVLLVLLLRSLRAISFAIGVSALLGGIILFLPWLFSGHIVAAIIGESAANMPEFLVQVGHGFKAAVLGIYIVSPAVLLAVGVGFFITGIFVFKKRAV